MHDCISKRQHARSMRRGGAVSPEATGLDAPRAAQRQTRTWRHKGHSSAHKDGGERRQGPWGSGGSGGRDGHRNRQTATGKTAESGEKDALCAYETSIRTLQTHPVTGAPLLSAAATTTIAARVAVLVKNGMDGYGAFLSS